MSRPAVPLAIVHHANQYLITNGYDNRPGIEEILGPPDASSGLRAVLYLHSRCNIPFHLHISGTLIEACAWFDPLFLEEIAELKKHGLVEILGSTYAQNIMPLFDREHNRDQIMEELRLIETWLHANPDDVQGFWVPERVWNTKKLAKVLADPTLPNGGFQYVLADDRLLLPKTARRHFDQNPCFIPELFEPCRIQDGNGLIALPISHEMRFTIPLETKEQEERLDHLISQLQKERENGRKGIAVYGDDMEKVAGIPPWNPRAIEHYRRFLEWLGKKQEVKPVLLQSWLKNHPIPPLRPVETGSYRELAIDFGAGEEYLNWAKSKAWAPYQQALEETWEKWKTLSSQINGPSPLLELARKHILACTYETAWHDAPGSVHTGTNENQTIASPAPWARALASHVRTASLLMEAVKWERDRDPSGMVHAWIEDLDQDGHEEVILHNHVLTAVITPRFGGRLIYLFFYKEDGGVLVIGNPSDDWNWLEELNDFMDVPMNHPGAFADHGFEHDAYEVVSLTTKEGQVAELVLANKQPDSPAFGLIKRFSLQKGQNKVHVEYDQIPPKILPLSLEIGLSPDYLRLLREGRNAILPYQNGKRKGFQNKNVIAWVAPLSDSTNWIMPRNPMFGHGFGLSLAISSSSGSLCLGVETTS